MSVRSTILCARIGHTLDVLGPPDRCEQNILAAHVERFERLEEMVEQVALDAASGACR